jgi:ferredoxin/flavodoxin---NADP+ reductase
VPATRTRNLVQTNVAANREIAAGVYLLAFPRFFEFVPGQSIGLTVDAALPARMYSIASGTSEPTVEVLYDVVPDGALTPLLARLRKGDALLVTLPSGAFRDREGPSCWVAAGTGVAPFLSMLRSGLAHDKALVHGSRTIEGLFSRQLFASALGERYFPCCSRETASGVFRGRPTEWLTERPLPSAERYLLCGSSRMVVDSRDVVIGKGVPFASVLSEIYF